MGFKLADDLFAGRGSARRAVEGHARVSEMEQEPVLEAGCRDGSADFRGAFSSRASRASRGSRASRANSASASSGSPGFLGSLVVIDDAPDFVQIGIPIAFPLNHGRDAGRPPLPAFRASDGHVRKIEVADEGQEVPGLGPGSFAQDRYSRQARPRSGSSSLAARRSRHLEPCRSSRLGQVSERGFLRGGTRLRGAGGARQARARTERRACLVGPRRSLASPGLP